MIYDGREIPDGGLLRTQVCVIGGGAAGIATCMPLVDQSIDVTLLEAGSESYSQSSQTFYAGTVSGAFPSSALTQFRLRQFGGTTGHWEGHVHPLDAIDFEQRDWVPNSGWPITLDALTPYYQQAAELLGLQSVPGDSVPASWRPVISGFSDLLVQTHEQRVFQVAPVRFAEAYGPELKRAPNVTVCLNAPVHRLETNEQRDRLLAVHVKTENGASFRVAARLFVLAAGCVENARLLLASGLGADHDVVGRYFSVHTLLSQCYLYMDSRYREALDACRGFEDEDTRYFTRMSITRAAQQRHKVMNCHVGVDAVTTSDADSLPSVLFAGRGIATRGLVQARLRLLAEQQPDPTNRILLSGDNDALGVPKVHVQWKYNDGDLESVRRSLEVLGRQVALLNAGRLHFPDVDTLSSMGVTPGHYMGATRMSTDPRSGVVNPECRMHAVSNVYVAGGSVFPTGGAANPTLTIVALALRLAQQLRAATRDEP